MTMQAVGAAFGGLIEQHLLHALIQVVFQNSQLIVQILADALQFGFFNLPSARILFDAIAREDPHVDDRTVHAGRHPQRGIFHIGRFLTENRP